MSQQIIDVTQNQPPVAKLFERGSNVSQHGGNVGAVAIEQERAIAEAQGQLILAKRFPRDLNAASLELKQSCRIKALADVAFYSVPRGGSRVSGPSIRLAEEIARCYGNFEYGHRELSRNHEKSEVEVYAWDKEKNNRSVRQITVMHTLDTKDGQRPLRDQKDIDDKIANVASKQVRGRILALLPKWMVEEAVQECRKTAAGNNDEPLEARVRKMVDSFGKFGVKPAQLAEYLGKPIEDANADDFADMLGVFNSIRDGAKIEAHFAKPAAPAMTEAVTKPAQADPIAPAAPATATRRASAKKPAEETAEMPPTPKPAAPPKAETPPPPPPTAMEEPTDDGYDEGDSDNPFDFGGGD